MTFGEWLRRKIVETRTNNAELARRVGVSPTYIGNLVRDYSPNTKSGTVRPSEGLVEKIAFALNANSTEARLAAGYAAPVTEPQTIRELKERLWQLGIHFELSDDLKDTPEDLERAKASIASLMNAIFPPKK